MLEYLAIRSGWTLRIQCPQCHHYTSESEWLHSAQSCTRCHSNDSRRSEAAKMPRRATLEKAGKQHHTRSPARAFSRSGAEPMNDTARRPQTRAYAPARGAAPNRPQPDLNPTSNGPNAGATRARDTRAGGSEISDSKPGSRSTLSNVRPASERSRGVLRPHARRRRLASSNITRGRHDDTTETD